MISFGPVPSRRLGKSLGINNIFSPRACTFNCIYCQVGKTREIKTKRSSYFKPEVIYESVIRHLNTLNKDNYPDYLTFVPNGEPTLDLNLCKSIKLLKKTGLPVAVITNASLLSDNKVREDLNEADWVSAKVDAAANDIWQSVNRPSLELDFTKHTESILEFAKYFSGKLNTETMIKEF